MPSGLLILMAIGGEGVERNQAFKLDLAVVLDGLGGDAV